QGAAITDILRGNNEPLKAALIDEISAAIRAKRFSAIILDNEWFEFTRFAADIEQHYEARGPVFSDQSVFWPVTGWQTRPELIFVPRP
ncbi:MAG: hypothetical protein L0177_17430, partial [Chloroflexi bacterium]|nr:hypothetical protein [Chloroflexota bacterium]